MTKDNENVTQGLLAILARQPFEAREVQAAIALLLEHPVARGEAEGQINADHIARLGARDWKLFHAIYDNTLALERVLDKSLARAEARRVWQRIEALQAEMDRAPKSLGWMFNQWLRKPTQVPR